MNMHTRQDVALKIVLDMSQFSCQVAHMMVIDKRDRPDRLFIVIPLLPDQIVPDQVPQCLRAIRILMLLDVQIKIFEQMVVQRHTKSNKLLHGNLVSSTNSKNVASREAQINSPYDHTEARSAGILWFERAGGGT